MAKKKSKAGGGNGSHPKKRHSSRGFLGGLAGAMDKVPKQVTRPAFFIAGVAAGKLIDGLTKKVLKITPKTEGKFSIKDDYKELIPSLVNIGLGVGSSTIGAKQVGEPAEFIGYGLVAYGVGSGVRTVAKKDFLGLGEPEFEGIGADYPVNREDAEAALRVLRADADAGFRVKEINGAHEQVDVSGFGKPSWEIAKDWDKARANAGTEDVDYEEIAVI